MGRPSPDPCAPLHPAPQTASKAQLRIIQTVHPSSSNPACQLVLGSLPGLEIHNCLRSGQMPTQHRNQTEGVHGAWATRHGLETECRLQMVCSLGLSDSLPSTPQGNQKRTLLSLGSGQGHFLPLSKVNTNGCLSAESSQNLPPGVVP